MSIKFAPRGASRSSSSGGTPSRPPSPPQALRPRHLMAEKAVQFQENRQAKSASKQAKAEQHLLKAFKSYRELGGKKSVDEYLAEAHGGATGGGAGGNASVDQ